MVSARIVSFMTGFAYLITFAAPVIAEPVDWASSGGDLFVSTGLPDTQTAANIERLISLPIVPARPPRRLAPPPMPPIERQRLDAVPIPDPQPTEDYGEVRLLPSNQPLDEIISKIAIETGLDPKLLHALVIIESAYNTRAVSPVGARGLTQLMPGTAAELGVRDVFNTEQNLRAGARYLAIQIGRFSDVRLALAAYNAGPNRVARLGRVPDFTETQNYVRDGIDCYLALTAGRGIRNRSQCRTKGR
jgi:soluble lytic murein transglycosylase-like protein